jgi:pyridoxal phosphate enzyme (YggS family)
MPDVAGNLAQVRDQIRRFELQYQRQPGAVRLLAVSKGQSSAAIRTAAASGQRDFGENYLQEARAKIEELQAQDLDWHFIGQIQSNKCRAIAEHFAWVHSLDRIRIARRLNDMRPAGAPPLNVCIEINISNQPTKSGIDPGGVREFAQQIRDLPRLRLRGLMSMPQPGSGLTSQREPMRRLYECYMQLVTSGFQLDTLSMGTTEDMEAAIAEGSTLVRIGTAIFGPRS